MPWKPDDWEKFNKGYQQNAGTAPSDSGGGMLGSLGAGALGAGKQVAQDFGATGDWTKPDPQHPTADWVGRQVADWAPVMAFDAAAPEVALPAAAARYAPRLASLAGKGLTAAYKGAVGGAAMQPNDPTRGGETGAETGLVGAGARAAWRALPTWAKIATLTAPGQLAGLASVWHEMGGGGRYISPWAVHHALGAAGGAVGAAAGAPATAGAAASALQNFVEPDNAQGK